MRDKELGAKMDHYIFYSTNGLSNDGQFKLLTLLEELDRPDFFNYVRGKLADRWTRLREILAKDKEKRFEIESQEGSFYLWVRCTREKNGERDDCSKVFSQHGIVSYPGPWYGVRAEWCRLNFAEYDTSTDVLFHRLEKIVSLP